MPHWPDWDLRHKTDAALTADYLGRIAQEANISEKMERIKCQDSEEVPLWPAH